MTTSDPILYPLPRGSVTSMRQELVRARTDLSDTLTELAIRLDPRAIAQRGVRRAARTLAPPASGAAVALIVTVATSRLRRRNVWYRLAALATATGTTVATTLAVRLLLNVRSRPAAPQRRPVAAATRATLPESPNGGDIVDVLIAAHRRIQAMFDHVAAADPAQRREAFAALVQMLSVHEHTEQNIVHPALAATRNGAAVTEARIAEEQTAERSLASLISLGPDHPRFLTQLAEVAAVVRAHAEREETIEFPLVRAQLSAQLRQSLATQVNAAQANV